jgi:hypothetical protein
VRQIHMHSESVYTVEQHLSCTVVQKNNGWAGMKSIMASLTSYHVQDSFMSIL